MSDIIRLLPDSVANQIAAGEVIQRPASVIKELVENAVDAGATDIRIAVKDAGKTMIQVIDNGSGMTDTDARMAFERHATSKIRNAEDLFRLSTMGFRGEALPSICAISEVDVRTRTADAQMGTRLIIDGSHVLSQEPVMCDKGTVFTVKKLFYNTPARRKFLKSDSVELANIMREFERLALVNNNIRMRLDTGTRQLDLRAGNLKQRISEIWKNNLDMHLVPVNVDTSLVKIEGYVSRPEAARRRNPLQFFFVNGRHMVHPYFRKAVLSCFENLIATDTQPNYFLKFTVDPETIDVNIHPTKNEIKFEYEQQIWPILTASVRAALGKVSAVPSIDFTVDAIPIHPLKKGEEPVAPEINYTPDYNPFNTGQSEYTPQGRAGSYHRDERPVKNWESLYDSFRREAHKENSGFFGGKRGTEFKDPMERVDNPQPSADGDRLSEELSSRFESENPAMDKETLFEADDISIRQICLQFAGKYIVTTTREGLMVIDQHRAHVRILYERYVKQVLNTSVASQGMLFPEAIELDEDQLTALEEAEGDLKRFGFVLEYEEGNTWRLMAAPSMIGNANAREMVLQILDSVAEDSVRFGANPGSDLNPMERMALVMARGSAITGGHVLTPVEMENILAELFALPDPAYTPNGNSIYCIVKEDTFRKLLNR